MVSAESASGEQAGGRGAEKAVSGEVAIVPPLLGSSQRLLNKDHYEVYYQVGINLYHGYCRYIVHIFTAVLSTWQGTNGTDAVYNCISCYSGFGALLLLHTEQPFHCLLVWVLLFTRSHTCL